MKLTMGERFTVLSVLPEQGNFATITIMRELRESLSPTEDEHKTYGIVVEGEQIRWSPKMGAIEKDIKIGNKAHSIVREALEKLDKEKKLEDRHYSLFEKFVEEK